MTCHGNPRNDRQPVDPLELRQRLRLMVFELSDVLDDEAGVDALVELVTGVSAAMMELALSEND